ncbi:ashwin [Spea bombifrons]|uniref:ashwin n=1 Tax=Spea bombifrons TaxID=233779 RepID=UPI00234919C2|nr:ashwin [Spea bombifrons]
MANVGNSAVERGCESEILLHPELLSRDFLLLSLEKKKIGVDDALNDKEKLTRIFVQHAMPLPRRDLPKSRWGKKMESKREQKKTSESQKKSVTADSVRKRPLIVFDGASTSTSIKVKKTENGDGAQRLQPSSTESANHVHQKLRENPTSPIPHAHPPSHGKEPKSTTANNHGHPEDSQRAEKTLDVKLNHPVTGSAVKIKRAAPKEDTSVVNDLKPTEPKRKIQHVTWP